MRVGAATRPRVRVAARRTGPSVPLAGVQLSKSCIGLFGWILEQSVRGVLVYGRLGGSVEAAAARFERRMSTDGS